MSVGSSPLCYLTRKRKDLWLPGQALLTGAKETTRKHSGLEVADDWLSSSSCLLYLLTALDSGVLLTDFTLWDIHTAPGINSALRLSLFYPGPSCSPPFAHSTCLDHASAENLCAILCENLTRTSFQAGPLIGPAGLFTAFPSTIFHMKCEEEVREQRGRLPLWVMFWTLKPKPPRRQL